MFACLELYDWEEIRTHTDRYWQYLRDSLRDYGFDAPDALSRGQNYGALWLEPELLLGQTCGLPYILSLKNKVTLIGRPAFDIDCGAGEYYSVLCVHKDCKDETLEDFAKGMEEKTYAYNDTESQSGFGAFHHTFMPFYQQNKSFAKAVTTGAHHQSIIAVGNGKADIAAIDGVSWEFAKRYAAETKKVRVLANCPPTPSTPYITSLRHSDEDVIKIHQAVAQGMAATASDTLEQLLLTGLAQVYPEDYEMVEERWNRVQACQQIIR